MEVKRFVIETDKRTGNELSKTDLSNIGEDMKILLMKAVVTQGLARAGFKHISEK